ncbi:MULTISPECIES: GNAT family N-acetyltransferase [Streptomyces]|uniref:GNAT family N-acetyltransferase n=1 Tax=Streptomyces nigrescens TaxID=1920 RepID=A0ABY7IXQ4_STRNI|nr:MULTISPECIES: GNAT family N-acetyltransferase [Streptomyces]AWN25009.1 GNAT family N-acetyltransferase [Streptomyces sp. NEAU-S7GS2]MCX5450646.1 GNAT family N-acetyltransferase [Streptomyces libani]WAU02216.1 GNAT family N-acetyltransferase [Streptomyces nigrescens]
MPDLVRASDGNWWPANVQTPRLVLRPVAEDDLRVAERLWRDERVRRYLGGPVSEAKIAVRRRTLPGSPGTFAITARDTNATIGMITIDPHSGRGATEVSYTLLPEHWGAGVGREAVAAALVWARSLPGTDRVVAVTQTANRASRRLLEAVGMRECGEMVEHGHPQIMYCG